MHSTPIRQINKRPRKILGYRTPKEAILGIQKPEKIALHS
jgi:IS30 family transposase